MSGVVIPRYMADVAELSFTAPSVYDALIKCMNIQPDVDPEAGYGVFQIPTLLLNLGLESLRCQKLIDRLDYNEYRLYLFIRSHYMGGFTLAELEQFIDGEIDFDFRKLHRDLLNFVPSFKSRGYLKLMS